jgi:hypothetical protein
MRFDRSSKQKVQLGGQIKYREPNAGDVGIVLATTKRKKKIHHPKTLCVMMTSKGTRWQ